MTQEEQQEYDRLVGENRVLRVMLDHLVYLATPAGQQLSQDQLLQQLRNNLSAAYKALPSAARTAADQVFTHYADFVDLGSFSLPEN